MRRLLLAVVATTLTALIAASAAAVPPPDGRVLELVTPGDTGRNVILGPYMARTGDRVVYGALAAFEGGQSNVLNTYVANRTASGWVNRPLQVPPRDGPLGWSPLDVAPEDASKVIASGIPGLIGATETILRRFNADGTPDGPPIIHHPSLAVQYATATPDMSRVWVYSTESLVPGETFPAAGRQVYEMVNGQAQAVGLLPGDAVPECGAQLAPDQFGFTTTTRGHAVSADGNRVFFLSPDPQSFGCPTSEPARLYTRTGGETVAISEAPPGATEQAASWVGAARDGSVAFFRTGTPLVAADDDETLDLYRWDAATGDNTCLTCVPGTEAFSGFESSPVVSEDGSKVYFVSSANLVPDPEATPDVPKIFVHDGTALEFVANTGQLGGYASGFPTGDMSDDGNHLLIQTFDQLTSVENNDHNTIYRYTHETDEIVCVSCPPDGGAVTSPANAAAQAFTSTVPTHAMSDDGSAIGFSTSQALVPGDTNGGLDTYRWLDGDIALVTDGVTESPGFGSTPNHAFFGVDRDGSNVVVSIFDRLVPEHQAGVQFYTARIGGRPSPFPPPPVPECEGDVCQGAGAPQAPAATPGSVTLNSPGNVTPAKKAKRKKCRKGFVRKRVRGKVRCVRRQGRANRSRRAADRTKKTALRRNK